MTLISSKNVIEFYAFYLGHLVQCGSTRTGPLNYVDGLLKINVYKNCIL